MTSDHFSRKKGKSLPSILRAV